MGVVFSERTRVVETITTDRTLKPTDTGKTFLLDGTTGATVTLPSVAKGLDFEFIIASTFITDNWIVDSAEGDNINGFIADMGSTVAVVLGADEDQINFVASAETVGDKLKLIADADNSQWIAHGICGANGGMTATDPS